MGERRDAFVSLCVRLSCVFPPFFDILPQRQHVLHSMPPPPSLPCLPSPLHLALVLFSKLYERIFGKNCENVVGFLPMPVGVAGPLLIDGEEVRGFG